MIKTFKSKPLATLWETGKSKIDKRMHKRILVRLERLDLIDSTDQLTEKSYQFHPLHGPGPTRYSIHVNGPWCITFEFEDGNAYQVDFEQYH